MKGRREAPLRHGHWRGDTRSSVIKRKLALAASQEHGEDIELLMSRLALNAVHAFSSGERHVASSHELGIVTSSTTTQKQRHLQVCTTVILRRANAVEVVAPHHRPGRHPTPNATTNQVCNHVGEKC